MTKSYIIERIQADGSRDFLESFRLEDYFDSNPINAHRFRSIEEAESHMERYFPNDGAMYLVHTVYTY